MLDTAIQIILDLIKLINNWIFCEHMYHVIENSGQPINSSTIMQIELEEGGCLTRLGPTRMEITRNAIKQVDSPLFAMPPETSVIALSLITDTGEVSSLSGRSYKKHWIMF